MPLINSDFFCQNILFKTNMFHFYFSTHPKKLAFNNPYPTIRLPRVPKAAHLILHIIISTYK